MTSIKHQLFSGVFYTALAKYSGIGVSLVVAGVLARLISPDDFGVMAIATVIIAFFNLFTDVGLSPAIIQHKGLTRENLSGLFSFTIWTGIGLALLFAAASWPIAAYYDREILRTLCQLLAVNLFFASATIVPNALFYRNKEFKFIALRSFVIQIATGAAAGLRPSLGQTDPPGGASRSGGSVRSRIVCAGHRAHPVGHPDFRGLHTTLSAAPEAYVGARRVAPDILLFCLPVPVQHHQLLQPEPRQTTDRQVHGNVSPGLL